MIMNFFQLLRDLQSKCGGLLEDHEESLSAYLKTMKQGDDAETKICKELTNMCGGKTKKKKGGNKKKRSREL